MAEISFYFTQNDSCVARLIRRAEMGFPYHHVGLEVAPGQYLSAHWQDGVQWRTPEQDRPRLYVRVPCPIDEYVRWRNWAKAQINRRYDRAEILSMAERIITATPAEQGWTSNVICSALALESLIFLGRVPRVKVAPQRTITPEGFSWLLMGMQPQLSFARAT